MRTPRPWLLPTRPVTRETLLAAGTTDTMIATQLAAGRLVRLRRGVFVAAESWPSDPAAQHLALARAEHAANPAAVLSHQTAAVVWGLPTPGFRPWHEDPPCVTYEAGGPERALRGTTVRHTATLSPPTSPRTRTATR